MYRQVRIFVPPEAPFDTELWAEMVIGKIISPLVTGPPLEWFWFSRYEVDQNDKNGDFDDCDRDKIKAICPPSRSGTYRSVRLRYSVPEDSVTSFEGSCTELISKRGCHASGCLEYNLIGDLGGNRHLGGQRTDERREHRADLVARFYYAISLLVLDSLTGPDQEGHFSPEVNDDKENPLKSSFESLHHLFCNITNVPLRVLISQVGVGTDWMPMQHVIQAVRVHF